MSLSIVDLDMIFEQQRTPPVILNRQDILSKEGREHFDRLLFTYYADDSLSPTPS